MQVNIINFGKIAEITGHSNLTIDGINDTDSLKSLLEKTYPGLKNTTYLMAVNKEVVNVNSILPENAIVALLPPFSGG